MDETAVAWIGVAGVAVGWVLTMFTDGIRRTWSKDDKLQDLRIERGEELLEKLSSLYQWGRDVASVVQKGDPNNFPLQLPLFRAMAIVDLYYPPLHEPARRLRRVVGAYRLASHQAALNRHLPDLVPEMNKRLGTAYGNFMEALSAMETKAKELIRAQVES